MKIKQLILPVCLLSLLLAAEGFKRDPATVEAVYSRQVYPVIIRSLNNLSGTVPLSLFELLLCVLLVALILSLGVLGWRLLHGRRERGHWRRAALRFLTVILTGVLLFNVLWGFNYYRLSLAEQLGLRMTEHTQEDLTALCAVLIQEANRLSVPVVRDENGVMALPGGTSEMLSRAAAGSRTAGLLRLPSGHFGPPKAVWNATAMSYAGISGMYSPFTGEAHVNGLIPAALLPATAMHELVHVYGYAREDEANFIAWLACREHSDADYRYSGALIGLIYGMNALYGEDPDAYRRLKEAYSAGVKADLAANRAFWQRYEGPAEELHEEVNDRYLKANGQADGTASYGRMVDLLLAVNSGALKLEN